jgi:hypothetical protein
MKSIQGLCVYYQEICWRSVNLMCDYLKIPNSRIYDEVVQCCAVNFRREKLQLHAYLRGVV